MSISKIMSVSAGLLLAAAGCVPNDTFEMKKKECDDLRGENQRLLADLNNAKTDVHQADKERIRTVASVAMIEQDLKKKYELSVKAGQLSTDFKIDGSKVVLGAATFKSGSIELSEEAKKFLDQLVPQIKDEKVKFLEIVGHTDKTPPASIKEKLKIETNLVLGVRRAEEVANYLMTKGVPEAKLIIASKGAIHDQRKVELQAFGG
jgi:outer membrane protein OmpA-like peptidoglycan-associated protein